MEGLPEAVERVVAHTQTMDVEEEDWQRAVAVDGLLAVDRGLEWVERVVDRAIATQTSAGQFAYGWTNYPKAWADWTTYDVETYKPTINSAAVASGALERYDRTGDRRYLEAVEKQYDFYDGIDRTADGGISRRLEHVELWTETLSFYCPFVARLGAIKDEEAVVADAADQALIHLDHLQDGRTGLFRHIWRETPDRYPESAYWSRANGWAVAGLLDTLDWLPADHSARETLEDALAESLSAIRPFQDATGFWHQILDDPTAPLETSGTLIFAYAFERAVDEGLVDDDGFHDAAERAMSAAIGVTDPDGAVGRVSKPPASAQSPLGVTPYGQGWFLRAAAEFL